jgi:hypothetical protein
MKLVNLEAALNRRPFRPFELRIDGEVIVLQHPEQALFAEGKTTLIVVDREDHAHILDVDQISKLRLLPRQNSSTKTRALELEKSSSRAVKGALLD